MPNGYENPAYDNGGGNVTKPKVSGGEKSGAYDNAANSTTGPQQSKKAKPAGRSAPSSGRDDAGINGDFGFKGHKKSRSPKI